MADTLLTEKPTAGDGPSTSTISMMTTIVPKLNLYWYHPKEESKRNKAPKELSPRTLEAMEKVAFAMEFDGVLWRKRSDMDEEALVAHHHLEKEIGPKYRNCAEFKKKVEWVRQMTYAQASDKVEAKTNKQHESPSQSSSLRRIIGKQ